MSGLGDTHERLSRPDGRGGMEATLCVCVPEPADLHPGGLDINTTGPGRMSMADTHGRGQ